jgi:spermidine synthase
MLLPRTLAAGAAATAIHWIDATRADAAHAHAIIDYAQHDWAVPTAALLAAAATVHALPEAVLPPPQDAPPRILERDSDALALSAPTCLALNALALALLAFGGIGGGGGSGGSAASTVAMAHSHAICWIVDWLVAVPATVLARSAFASADYDFDDPADWRSAAQWSTLGRPIFEQASSVDAASSVRVHEHSGGWRSLRFLNQGGAENVQSFHRMVGANTLDAEALANEYLKAMVSLAFIKRLDAPRVLCLGLGGGSLASFFRVRFPGSQIVAVELDAAVIEAATSCLGLRSGPTSRTEVHCSDALEWVRSCAVGVGGEECFDLIFVDVFDHCNVTPPPFYARDFASDLRLLLAEGGLVLQNLHTGSRALDAACVQALATYSAVFGQGKCCSIPVKLQGNTILAAGREPLADPNDAREDARENARLAGLRSFDVTARLERLSVR